jgi:hypothetical protein
VQHPSFSFPSQWIPLLECGLLAVGLLVALVLTRRYKEPTTSGGSSFERGWLARLSTQRVALWQWIVVCFLVGLVSNAAITLVMGHPKPHHGDSGAYMFAAETFAAGRITSPAASHQALVPSHVVADPLVSKYPPALGLVLALGILLGNAGIGLWLLTGGMLAASMWCFEGWMGRRWALFGVVLLALRLGIGSYWNHSYWGGSVAAIGSLLVFGAVGWLLRRPGSWSPLFNFAGGLVMLAHSRPFEGLVVALPVMSWVVLAYLPGLAARERPSALRSLVLLTILGMIGVASVLAYNRASTGDPWVFAHQQFKAESGMSPEFLWQRRIVPPVTGATSAEILQAAQTPVRLPGWQRRVVQQGIERANSTLFFLLGPVLTLAWLLGMAGEFFLRSRGEPMPPLLPEVGVDGVMGNDSLASPMSDGILLSSVALVLVSSSFVDGFYPHYVAPATAPLWLLALRSLVRLGNLARQRPDLSGLRALASLATLALIIQTVSFVVQLPALRQDPDSFRVRQYQVHDSLVAAGGRHLVLVARSDAGLLNTPDMEAAAVLWARDLGPDSTLALIDDFADRQLWLYDPFVTPELQRLDREQLRAALTSGQGRELPGVR